MIKISCFSEINNSILMWSHYADYRQGFCIKYDISKMRDNRTKQSVFPVVYSDNLYKYKEWEYEKEWRIIYPEEHNCSEDKYNFNFSNAITGIYLGLNANKTIKQKKLGKIKE